MKIALVFLLILFKTVIVSAQDSVTAVRQNEAQRLNALVQPGNFVAAKKAAHGITIQATNAYVSLVAYSATMVRVRLTKQENAPARDFSFAVVADAEGDLTVAEETKDKVILATDSLLVVVQKQPLRIDFLNKRTGQFLSGDDETLGMVRNGSEVTSYRKMADDEKFYGLGQKTGDLNHRTKVLTNLNTDAYGFKPGSDPMYSTMPFFMGIHDHAVYGIYFDNSYQSTFDFNLAAEDHMYYSFSAAGGDMSYYFFGAPTMAQIISDYTHITGRSFMPPLYGLGYIQSRYSYMTEDTVLMVMKKMRDNHIPCDLIFCDIDYMDHFKVFTWDKTRFAHPRQMVDSLRKMGAHLYVILDPALKIEKGYSLYDEGIKDHHFAYYPGGEPFTGYVWAGASHYTNFLKADTRAWWKEHLKVYTNGGITGFLNDMNEPAFFRKSMPDALLFGEEKDPYTFKEARNVYGFQMARSTYEGVKEQTGLRPFNISRSAFSGIQRYSSMWTGDNEANDIHMFMDTRMSLSLSLTGLSFVGMNIGGFTGNPTPELMARWMQLGVYMPLFINHTVGSNPHEPYAFDTPVRDELRRSIRYRYSLLPYIYSAFYQASAAGIPVLKALPYNYTFDSTVYKTEYQHEFLCGANLLVVPALSTADSVKMYLPEGLWYRQSTGMALQGPLELSVAAPMNDLPVFVKSGSVIPMQTPVEYVSQPSDGILQLHLWYGKEKTFCTYYEDDGATFKYEKGDYYKRNIVWEPSSGQLSIQKREGSYTSRFKQIKLVLHQFPKTGHSLQVNGKKAKIDLVDGTEETLVANADKEITIKVVYK